MTLRHSSPDDFKETVSYDKHLSCHFAFATDEVVRRVDERSHL